MGYYFRKVVMVALLVVAYSGAAWADNLTVTVTRTGAGVADAPKSGQASLLRPWRLARDALRRQIGIG